MLRINYTIRKCRSSKPDNIADKTGRCAVSYKEPFGLNIRGYDEKNVKGKKIATLKGVKSYDSTFSCSNTRQAASSRTTDWRAGINRISRLPLS
jgi:hypothetical protein